VRSCLLSLVVFGACAADAEQPPPAIELMPPPAVASVDSDEQDTDVCALASALPTDDICSLICDPLAMATRMADDGNDRGACYHLYCSLPGGSHVLVGICLPP
jgi:hypothetical protein